MVNKYIMLAMIPMIALFIGGLFYSGSGAYNQKTFDAYSTYSSEAVNGTFLEDGIEKSLETGNNEYNFAINDLQGIISIVIAVSVIASLIGIQVLGSGLSEFTVKVLYNTIFYYGIWALFSVYSLALLLMIPVGGWIIYFIFTSSLSYGIVQQING